jgi:predicted AlkP superfamily phosphohydrolase/phosphomutase
MQRVFMVGWDGATFDLIKPWVEQGKLPHIAKLMESGVHGLLRSTLPPWTFPAWTSFMTGKNPGKHGIFDFFRSKANSYDLEFVNGGHRRADTFWKILSRAGRRVVSISLPCTFPPERVNGIMISGFDFPGEGPGSHVDAKGMYPPEVFDELTRTVGRHPIDTPIAKDINEGRPEAALENVLNTIKQKAATAKYLLNREWDCFMILFGESDGCAHQFWKYCDPKSPLFEDYSPVMRESLFRIYQELDVQLGELMEQVAPDAVVMLMSDHGFGGSSDWVIHPNRWLEEQGFLRFRGDLTLRLSRLGERMKHWGFANLPSAVQRFLYRCATPLLNRFESTLRHSMIDWDRTEAYFEENPYFPFLRVNLRGRQPRGIVQPGRHYEQLCERLTCALQGWQHPVTGDPIVERVYRREEAYSGPFTGEAPDLVVKWALYRGYNYVFRLSSKAAKGQWIQQFDARRADHGRYFNHKSGSHRDDGVFVASGPGIKTAATIDGARIIDLAPTILHLLDVSSPIDMDGKVLEAIFEQAPVLASRETVAAPTGSSAPDAVYSAEDEHKIAERLQSLGYVD